MRRFVYSPDVQAFIATTNYGVIDVSADVVSGIVNRKLDAASSASLVLQNRNKKYIRRHTGDDATDWFPIFMPMDRIVIFLTRIHQPMQVFAGYLDSVPYELLYPQTIELRASCTLKRLLYSYWDPGLPYVSRILKRYGWIYDPSSGTLYSGLTNTNIFDMDPQGGLGQLLRDVLFSVGGWPITKGGRDADGGNGSNTVHVLSLPQGFIDKARDMLAAQVSASQQQQDQIEQLIKTIATVQGIEQNPLNSRANQAPYSSSYTDGNPLPGSLAHAYTANIYGPPIIVGAAPQSMTGLELTNRQQYGQMAADAANKYGIPSDIFFGLIRQETRWGTITGGFVNGPPNSAGAVGLTQVVPPKYQYQTAADLLGSASAQLDAGAHVLSDNFNQFGQDWSVALAVYNGGPAMADKTRWATTLNNPNDPTSSVQNYVNSVLNFAQQERSTVASSSQNVPPDEQGQVGNVKVPSSWNKPSNQVTTITPIGKQGYTFHISPNPFNDNSIIFKATAVDASLNDNEISIYVPGAANNTTSQASNWAGKSDHTVTVETSQGSTPFTPRAPNQGPSPDNPSGQGATGPGNGAKLVQIAQSQIGVSEQPDGSNTGPMVNQFLASTNTSPGNPWCMAFASWCLKQVGNDPFPTASVPAFLQHAQQSGWITTKPQAGDLATYGVPGSEEPYHVGIIESVAPGGQFTAIEGNFGNQVSRVNRTAQQVDAFVRVPFVNGTANTTQTPGSTGQTAGGVSTDPSGASPNLTLEQVADASLATVLGFGLSFPTDMLLSVMLTGDRALQNDVPLMEWVQTITKASGRRFQSLPNGDFIAFYPDYFGWSDDPNFNTPYLLISDLEVVDLTINLTDDNLVTHFFTVGDVIPTGSIDWVDQLYSTVASVETIGVFKNFVIGDDGTFDAIGFLKRFGVRPYTEEVPEIKHPIVQFLYGWSNFMQKWAEQFECNITTSFLPELYPGGLVKFKDHDIIAFVEEVTHSFDRASGFTTAATLTAPHSATKSTRNRGLALATEQEPNALTIQNALADVNKTLQQLQS
jgi:soluble lytic murein transglycosylase-like protein